MDVNTSNLRQIEHEADLCVVGGGLAGMAAAIAAAREGARVVLMQDRPVLGGNASSEIRMWVRGAAGLHNRETGILSELEEENIYRNPSLVHSLWDSVLWGKVRAEPNITLLLNCSCVDADTAADAAGAKRIVCVKGWQLTTYTWHAVRAKYFADCSGDSILAPLTGALYRVGREGNDEFRETIGPAAADRRTMGMSCLMQARETDRKVRFIPPEWAYVYERDCDFDYCPPAQTEGMPTPEQLAYGKTEAWEKGTREAVKKLSRNHSVGTNGTNFWWIELGGEHDSIHDTEILRDELLKTAFGIWDHIKNRGDHGADNWELEWVGFLPGKRESRRYVGAHVLTQNDVEAGGPFDDIVAYGGWTMDDHHPAGIRTPAHVPPSMLHPAPSPYGIPYRVLHSANIANLFFAGRNISATHAAISSTRVMATCTLLGQAMGTAAAMCVLGGLAPGDISGPRVRSLQNKLLDAGCYLPGLVRAVPELSRRASLNLAPADRERLFDGRERPDRAGTVHYVQIPLGEAIEYSFAEPTRVSGLRVMFDPDFSRQSVSSHAKMRVFAQKCHTGLDFEPMRVAATLVKSFEVHADGECVYATNTNHNALFRLRLDRDVSRLAIRLTETWGADSAHVFSCDLD